IARISRGRSIREFVLAVLVVPTVVSILWFSAFGMSGVETGLKAPQIFELTPETQLFGIFNELPFSLILSIFTLILIASFFITSADSATFVLGMQTSFGNLKPANFIK